MITVKHIGHLLRQLIALSTQNIVLDVSQQGLYLVSLRKFGQQAPKSPDQGGLVKGHGGRNHILTQDQTVHAPNKAGRQLGLCGCTNSHGLIVCQGHFEPMLHAIALYQKGFGHQRWQGVVAKQADREIAQVFQAVAMEHHESWLSSVGHEFVAGVCR